MKAKTFILVTLATVTGWQGFCPIRSGVSSGGVLEGYGLNSVSQESIDQANYKWQRDKLIAAAQKSAAQAAAYAAQAAVYNNDAARQAAGFATQAASYADQAAGKVVSPSNT